MVQNPQTKSSKTSDDDLIDSYQKTGDMAVLGELYQPYMSLVYGLCLKYLKDKDLSKDAVMQIFEELVSKLKNHEIKNFKSWLYVLSKNYCLMQLRKSQKHQMVNIEDAFMESESIMHHDNIIIKETKLTLMEECIEALNHEQKMSVKLFYLDQKCYNEVSEKTGYDLKKVKSYIQNGKRNLKNCIEGKGG